MAQRLTKTVIAAAFALACLTNTGFSSERPNVLFIVIDDLNDWVGCLGGHAQAQTPNIDRLAERGILFTNAHCAAPACNPSRASVFSGLMPYRTGVWSNDSPRLIRQHPDLPLIPSVFKSAGYTTMGTGKLLHSKSANQLLFDRHFNSEQRWSPLTSDSVRYTEAELPTKGTAGPRHVVQVDGRDLILPLNRMPSDRNPDDDKGESFDWGPMNVPDSAMGDTKITNWAIDQLQEESKKPFFLAVGYYRPHIPLWAPRKYFERFGEVSLPLINKTDLDDLGDVANRWAIEPITAGRHATVIKHGQWKAAVAAYLACTTFVDHQIGRLLDELDNGASARSTLIVLWSDHGWHLGEKQHWGKWTGWERSTRVPLIIVPPRNQADVFAEAGAKCEQPVSLVDLYPTLAELCNVAVPAELDGQSLVPLLRAPYSPTERTVVTTFKPGNVTLRDERWRYIRYSDGSEELYDHRADPNEWQNLANEQEHAPRLLEFRSRTPASAIAATQEK